MKKTLQEAAKKGQGEDTLLAHLTPGETIVPEELMQSNGSLRQAIADAFAQAGVKPGQYIAGGQDDARNPETGLSMFDFSGNGEQDHNAADTPSVSDFTNATGIAPTDNLDTQGQPPDRSGTGSFLADILGIPTSWADLKNKVDPNTQRGFFNAITAFAPQPIGFLGNIAAAINDRYFDGKATAGDTSGPQNAGDNAGAGSGSGAGINPNQFFGSGISSSLSWPGVNDWRYSPNTSPGAVSPGRQQFLQALARVNDSTWLRSNVGFASGDDLLDNIFMPYEQGAFDYLGRAQKRGMLDVPRYQAAADVLKQQGQQGRNTLRTKLTEQGDSFLQPLRATASKIEGDVLSGKFDSTAFSDQFVNDLFGGAINDTKSRVGEFGNNANDPFAPATALYQGLEQGGNVQGSPLYSAIADASKSRYSPLSRNTSRGVGSKGVF